jgi:hypothetical protein
MGLLTSVDTFPDHHRRYTRSRVLPPACCPDWRCCFTVEPTPPERDGAAPNRETVEAEETGDNPSNCRETAPPQDEGERANPPDATHDDPGDRGDNTLRCLGRTPQPPGCTV